MGRITHTSQLAKSQILSPKMMSFKSFVKTLNSKKFIFQTFHLSLQPLFLKSLSKMNIGRCSSVYLEFDHCFRCRSLCSTCLSMDATIVEVKKIPKSLQNFTPTFSQPPKHKFELFFFCIKTTFSPSKSPKH